MPTHNQEAPSVFAAFATAIDQLIDGQTGREELRSLCTVLDGVLSTTAGLLPDSDSGARARADGAMARLRAHN